VTQEAGGALGEHRLQKLERQLVVAETGGT
jgi:hypothetical protein